jgi:UDP-N-acetylglucosamine 4,6-dehydratase
MPIADHRYLVTGGTGSFGNFIVHRLLDEGAREVRVFSRDEKKQYDMRVFYGNRPDLTTVVGDLRDYRTVMEAMDGIDIVFQAAALKQVPTCERFPMEAVRTNVLGAENVVDAALRHQVKAVVAISTDKAVKPVNAMGMTKALQERLVLRANLSQANHGTCFCSVRYGNVLRSRGSVVPFFRQQLARGQRLTITHEGMTRFLLTLNEAIDLVLYAAEATTGGEVFVKRAPSARVLDIAAVLSAEAGVELDYEVIGILPGEKLNELLVSEEELRRTEDMGTYLRIHPFWSDVERDDLTAEYSSATGLVGHDELRRLIAASDAEFEAMEMVGEFAKF